MTALIIGLIAALGIGGGVAIANNSGGHGGGGSAVVSGPVEPGNPTEENAAAHLNPNYSLVSALADDNQYEVTAATVNTLLSEGDTQAQSRAARRMKAAAQTNINPYNGNHKDDLIGGHILLDEDSTWALDLKPQEQAFRLGKYQDGNFSDSRELKADTAANQSQYYDTYRLDNENNPEAGKTGSVRYDVLHLGGAKSNLTVADFGRWETAEFDTNRSEEDMMDIDNGNNLMRTFFLYDEKYAYKGGRDKDVAMQGNVLVDTPDILGLGLPRLIFTAGIFMNLNLAQNRLTGRIQMNEKFEDKDKNDYNIDSFTGSILGSLLRIDQEGDVLGGIGKLLTGKNGLETVGQLSKQITYQGSTELANYTFGAWEIGSQKDNLADKAAKLKPDYGLITALADTTQYQHVILNVPIEQDKNAWIKDGTQRNRRGLAVGTKEGAPALIMNAGTPYRDANGQFTGLEVLTPITMTKNDRRLDSTEFYDHYRDNTGTIEGTWAGINTSYTQQNDLYLAGSKVGLTVSDFGFWNENRKANAIDGLSTSVYHNFELYDASFLYAGGRSDTIDMKGTALMIPVRADQERMKQGELQDFHVLGGDFNMTLHLADGHLEGNIDMSETMRNDLYNVDFTGKVKDNNQISFTGSNINPMSYGTLLQGKDGLEAVGTIESLIWSDEKQKLTHNNLYTFGAKEE